MAIRIVRLGSPRSSGEGLRIGTVRRPPRGVPKAEFSSGDWYDVWFPLLAPSAELVKFAQAAKDGRDWQAFFRRYRAEMAKTECVQAIALLAALSQKSDFSLGCYCEDAAHCHRSALAELLAAAGAEIG